MKLDFIALAIPFFVSFMILEYYISVKKHKKTHQFQESIANINVGIFERICDLLTSGTFFFIFSWLHQNYALFKIESNWMTWILLFLATDFVWYWYHRLGHEVNILWAAHIVHHQSEDFNYTAAARITVFQAIARGFFWSILPVIGFPAHMILILLLIHGTYPFFTHTQLIGKLGWLEYIIVTPTHHGVHHSSNEEYLDKNYGDMLIIWDKIFGTYAEETKAPQYGLTKPLESYSFLWQHFHYFLEIYIACKRANTFMKKVSILFGKPNDHDPRIRGYLERKFSQKVTNIPLTKKIKKAILIKTISTTLLLFFTILFSQAIPKSILYFLTFFIVMSVIITGAMLEQKKWIFHLEFFRLCLLFIIINSLANTLILNELTLTLLALAMLYYKTINQKYQQFLFST